jgi:hypothetical protein
MINEVKHFGRMLNASDGSALDIFRVRIPVRCLLLTLSHLTGVVI